MCVNDDRETYGETYWHRKHQIRNMSICTKHKCRLKESTVPAKSEQSFTFCPAESYIGNEEAVVESDPLVIQLHHIWIRYLMLLWILRMMFR